jgi:hypothetical protein
MKSDEVGTTLKHPETINGNVKNLSKRIKRKDNQRVLYIFPKTPVRDYLYISKNTTIILITPAKLEV